MDTLACCILESTNIASYLEVTFSVLDTAIYVQRSFVAGIYKLLADRPSIPQVALIIYSLLPKKLINNLLQISMVKKLKNLENVIKIDPAILKSVGTMQTHIDIYIHT